MKKSALIIFVIVMLCFVANLVYGQDCGKCPMKSDCSDPKAADNKDPFVYVAKTDKFYHMKECKTVVNAAKDTYKEVKLSEAVKAELKPCAECKPPVVKTIQQVVNK
jgi:hypothetical protein